MTSLPGYTRIVSGGCALHMREDLCGGSLQEAVLGGPEVICSVFGAEAVAASRFARLWRFRADCGIGLSGFYYKLYLDRSFVDRAKRLLRGSRARRAFQGGQVLAGAGFLAPETAALLEPGRFSGFNGALLSFEITDTLPLHRVLEAVCGPGRPVGWLAVSLGRTIGRLHAAGIFHGDLRVGNILACCERGTWRFWFLDNERTRRFRRLPWRLRVKNLVQVNMHRSCLIGSTDRMRFFKAYLKECGLEGSVAIRLARAVISKTEKRHKD